jgi:hypothetical protein
MCGNVRVNISVPKMKKFNVRVIGDIDRHILKPFKSSLRAAACV